MKAILSNKQPEVQKFREKQQKLSSAVPPTNIFRGDEEHLEYNKFTCSTEVKSGLKYEKHMMMESG